MKNSSSKPQSHKAAKRRRKGDSEDRLSYLPDSVLCHILSFLETKPAVQTSILSRQWRYIWKHVPVINIQSDRFESSCGYGSFKRFVDKVLSLRGPLNLRKVIFIDDAFGLDEAGLYVGREESLFARVIKYALSNHTQHLKIDLQNNGGFAGRQYPFSDMFGSISDCSLETLELSAIALDVGWTSSSFRVLTKLELIGCEISLNGEDVVEPFSRFPCLKDLVLGLVFSNDDNDNKVLRIVGPQLLSLDLGESYICNIGIYAPKLKSFTLEDFSGVLEFSELTLPSLDYACVSVHFGVRYTYIDGDYKYDYECQEQYMSYLFNQLNNAKSLVLHYDTVKVLSNISEFLEKQPSPFTRLKFLTMKASQAPFEVINYFLKGSSSIKPIVKFK